MGLSDLLKSGFTRRQANQITASGGAVSAAQYAAFVGQVGSVSQRPAARGWDADRERRGTAAKGGDPGRDPCLAQHP